MLEKSRITLGLDAGVSSIKSVKLKLISNTCQLLDFYCQASDDSRQMAKLSELLKSQEAKRVNIAVSGPAVVSRYVAFPRMSVPELKQALKFEAQKYIPFLLTEINLDCWVLKNDLVDNKMLVMLAAVKKDFLNQRLKVFQDLGVEVNIVDIDTVALSNAFIFNYGQDELIKAKTVALLNIGAAGSNLNFIENGVHCLSRDINIAGNSFTQKISDSLGIDFKSAEALKIEPEKEKAEKIAQCIESILTFLAGELRVSFDYYESQSAASVSQVFLSGGGSLFTGLKDMLANILDIKVEYWDPFKRIDVSPELNAKLKGDDQLSSRLAVSVGLALR